MPADLPPRRLRVLFVPDFLPWITGTIARQIAAHNPWIEATICTGTVLARLAARSGGRIPVAADVIHYLTEYEPGRCARVLPDGPARVHALHHVESWELARSLIGSCDAVHVGSRQWERELIANGSPPARTVRVPYGVDPRLFRPPTPPERQAARREAGVAADEFAVGMFAKKSSDSSDRKGVDVFAAAVTRLRAAGVPAVAVVVGPGWDGMAAALQAAGVRCARQRVARGPAEVARLYHTLDVYWITSRIEGGPVTLLEAMASGVPCASTPVGLVPEVIADGENGFLVPVGDAAGFAARSRDLWADADRRARFGAAARDTILRGWTWERTTQSVARLYEAALAHSSARTGRPVAADVAAAAGAAAERAAADPTVALPALPPRLRGAARAEEMLSWIRELLFSGDVGAAGRAAAAALAAEPGNRTLAAGLTWVGFREVRTRLGRWLRRPAPRRSAS